MNIKTRTNTWFVCCFRRRASRVSQQRSGRSWRLLGDRRARTLRLAPLRRTWSLREGRDDRHRREPGAAQPLPAGKRVADGDGRATTTTGPREDLLPATTQAVRLATTFTRGQ